MSHNAAGEERLGDLHTMVADTLIEQLKGTPVLDDEGQEIGRTIDPRVIASAITFLNNNKITANPFLDEKMSEIQEALHNRKTRFRAVDPQDAASRAAANE